MKPSAFRITTILFAIVVLLPSLAVAERRPATAYDVIEHCVIGDIGRGAGTDMGSGSYYFELNPDKLILRCDRAHGVDFSYPLDHCEPEVRLITDEFFRDDMGFGPVSGGLKCSFVLFDMPNRNELENLCIELEGRRDVYRFACGP
jgi:hypothetical protein